MEIIITIVHVVAALALIGFVLIQQGKGADAGAAFGGGASATVFGSSGSGNFLSKATTFLAVVFFSTSLVLSALYGRINPTSGSVIDTVTETEQVVDQATTEVIPDDVPNLPEDGSIEGELNNMLEGDAAKAVDVPMVPEMLEELSTDQISDMPNNQESTEKLNTKTTP